MNKNHSFEGYKAPPPDEILSPELKAEFRAFQKHLNKVIVAIVERLGEGGFLERVMTEGHTLIFEQPTDMLDSLTFIPLGEVLRRIGSTMVEGLRYAIDESTTDPDDCDNEPPRASARGIV